MKAKVILFLFVIVLLSFAEKTNNSKYSYLLTVTSVDNGQHSFNLKISSKHNAKDSANSIFLENQKTPFKYELKSGIHEIIVDHLGEKGKINTKVTGILNGKTMGSASSDDSGAILKAGPGGSYSVNQ